MVLCSNKLVLFTQPYNLSLRQEKESIICLNRTGAKEKIQKEKNVKNNYIMQCPNIIWPHVFLVLISTARPHFKKLEPMRVNI